MFPFCSSSPLLCTLGIVSKRILSAGFSRSEDSENAKKIKQPKESLQEKERSGEIQRQTESKEDLTIAQISDRTDQKISQESETSEQKESEETGKKKKRKISLIERIKKWIQTIKNVITLIRKRIRQAEWLKVLWQDDNTQAFVCILKDNVLHLWRKCKPKKFEAKVCFGTGQPDTTGEILAVLAIFYACYGSSVTIIPDFEQTRLEGWIRMKGHISVFTVLVILINIFMSKEWKQFRKDTSRWKEAF